MFRFSMWQQIFFWGNENATGGVLNKKEMYARTQELLDRVGARSSRIPLVKKLGVAEKQMVEICKALSINSKIIIMGRAHGSFID